MPDSVEWDDLPVVLVDVQRLVWPCHDIDPSHLHPDPGAPVSSGPIYAEALIDGSLFVHDGRHRAIRARLAGVTHVLARVVH